MATPALPVYRTSIDPAWIDYNGHLRDAYYGLILSYAIDAVMDDLGLDASYRVRTGCTLYTLEQHMHFCLEVKGTDELDVTSWVLDADAKRLHLGCRFERRGSDRAAAAETVATGDVMMLHVQQGATPSAAPFPAEIDQRLSLLRLPPDSGAAWGPRSRKIEIRRRTSQ